MFDDDNKYETYIRRLVDLFQDNIEGLLEELDITLERALEILIEGGHVEVPPYVLDDISMNTQEEETLDDEFLF